jgi:hypothetical protein
MRLELSRACLPGWLSLFRAICGIACVRLIIVELQGPQAARETEIRLVTPTAPLSALYAECMRLSGHAACWGVVQELQLKARAQQGVRPNQGVPVVAL